MSCKLFPVSFHQMNIENICPKPGYPVIQVTLWTCFYIRVSTGFCVLL